MEQGESSIIAAVDIGTTKVCTVIAEINSEEINIMGVGWHENAGVSKGAINNIAATTDAIRKSVSKAEEMAKVRVEGVLTSVSGKHIMGIKGHGETTLSHTKQKMIEESDKDRAMEGATSVRISQDREIMHILPIQYIVDGQDEIEDPLGMTGLKLEVDAYAVTGAITAIENVRKVIQNAGLSCEDVILQGIASSCAVLYPDEKDVGVLLIDIGGGTTDMAIYYRKALRFVKVIPVGGVFITNDLVQGLQTPKATAEEIKKKYGLLESENPEAAAEAGVFGNPAAEEYIDVPDMGSNRVEKVERRMIAKFIQPRVRELIKFVEEELKKEGIEKSMYAGGIVLTGGTSLLKGIDRAFREELGVRVRIGSPLKEKVVGLYDIVSTPEYATVIGLIEYYMRESKTNNIFLGGNEKGFMESAIAWIKKNIVDKI
ncbi:MAG: cell division protein FtsA [Spirochaetia bacterium]|nr:cell division protein FtsA [Spirochaetia bacterium]